MGMRVIPYMSHNTQYVHMHDLHGMAELWSKQPHLNITKININLQYTHFFS